MQSIVYTTGYLGMQLALGGFKDGDNKIVIKATGYKDKTITVNKSGDTYTFVSQTDGDSTAEPEPTPTPTPSIQDPTEDGVYTVTFKATKENSEESSMLGGYFEGKVKLKVENGEMKLSMLMNIR